MSIILVIGGAGSGKSEFAESLCIECGEKLTYLATMKAEGNDVALRIRKHRELREGKGFKTVECASGLDSLELPYSDAILLECLGNLVANELFDEQQSVEQAEDRVLEGISHLAEQCDHLVIVGNDIFCDGVSYAPETQAYVNLLAEITESLAHRAHEVVEVVCGIPIWQKNNQGSPHG